MPSFVQSSCFHAVPFYSFKHQHSFENGKTFQIFSQNVKDGIEKNVNVVMEEDLSWQSPGSTPIYRNFKTHKQHFYDMFYALNLHYAMFYRV